MDEEGKAPAAKDDIAVKLRSQLCTARGASSAAPDLSPYAVLTRRLISFVIDCVFLVGIGRLAAFLAKGVLLPLGDGGWWVGLAVAALYFTLMDSSVAGGKSFGKRLMRIEVRRKDGGFIHPVAALVRFVPIAALFVAFFGERQGDPASAAVWAVDLAAILTLLAIGTFAAVHPMRRSLGDLAADSVVVRAGCAPICGGGSSSEPALVFGVMAALILVAVLPLRMRMAGDPLQSQLSRLRLELGNISGISDAKAALTIGFAQNLRPAFTLAIDAFVMDAAVVRDPARAARLSEELAAKASSVRLPALEQITVSLRSGFNIGIWQEMDRNFMRFPAGARAPVKNDEPRVIFRSTPGKSRNVPRPSQGVPVPKGAKPDPKAKK